LDIYITKILLILFLAVRGNIRLGERAHPWLLMATPFMSLFQSARIPTLEDSCFVFAQDLCKITKLLRENR